MADAVERLRDRITLISPEGREFEAYYRSDEPSAEKNIGRFEYPGTDGTKTQDLGLQSRRFSITYRFEGINHDLVANRHEQAFAERGPWTVIHPVLGELELQPISYRRLIEPVENAFVTRFSVDWIEIPPEDLARGEAQLAAEIREDNAEIAELNAATLEETIDPDDPGMLTQLRNATADARAQIETPMRRLASRVGEIQADLDSILANVTAIIEAPAVDTIALAGALRSLFATPILAVDDARARIRRIREAAGGILESADDIEPSSSGIARVATLENTAVAAVQAACLSVTDYEPGNRAEAVQVARNVAEFFDFVVDGVDKWQAVFSDTSAREKFFALLQVFPLLAAMASKATRLMLRRSYDVAIERRIVLDRPRAPIEIAITEYGGLGEDDANLDRFVRDNELTAPEVYLLPAGREVVVYQERS